MVNGIKYTQNKTRLPHDQSLGVEKANTKPAQDSQDSTGRKQEEEEPQRVRAKGTSVTLNGSRLQQRETLAKAERLPGPGVYPPDPANTRFAATRLAEDSILTEAGSTLQQTPIHCRVPRQPWVRRWEDK